VRHDEAIAEAAALTDRSDLARVPIAAKEVTAVAAGLFRWRKGTDALGSVCSPAAICGLVDITPGSGTVRASDFSDWSRMYTHGPLATTVSGAAALLSVLGPLPC
jgi:amidase